MKEKILELIVKYREDLERMDAEPILTDENCQNQQQATDHAFAILNQIEDLTEKNQIEKAYRWLGFVQAILFVNGKYSFKEINQHHWLENNLV